MNQLTRDQIARQCGINREAVRYYERLGLLPEPGRSRSGYCVFPESVVKRIHFIKRAQSVGFSLYEIKILLTAIDARNTLPIETQIQEIDSKIQALQSLRSMLVSIR